ncbi:MAG TPA: CARDB domain-containing protein [Catalimonadaceae bacterium]|nr:CARDB domain-containing protein [Catalimonadaceae bacterium]
MRFLRGIGWTFTETKQEVNPASNVPLHHSESGRYHQFKNNLQPGRLLALAVFLLAFICLSAQAQVNRGEYFFDTDPGIGNGFNLTASTAGDSITINQTVSVSGLSEGFHTLFVRTRMSKHWSQTESRGFFISSASSLVSGPISGLEYFFDTDPGVGLGTKITVSPSADSSEKTAVVPISSLSAGFHTLYIRAKSNRGYSMTESRSFFIASSASLTAGPISGLEYFFDTDPGVGLGTKIAINPSADSSEKTAIIPVSSLSSGFHTLFIRARNNRGYGMAESRSFFIVSSASLTAGPITGLEYFFDTDPGVGLATKIAINPSADSSEKTSVIPVSSLSAGFHTLYIRAKNNRGYGQTESRSFFVVAASSLASGKVSRIEYFIDTDPGVGLGTALQAFSSGDSVEVTRVITIPTSITLGDHKLYVRSQTTDGRWAITESNDFNIACGPPEITSTQTQLCPGASTILTMTGGNLPGTYQWLRNGVAIPGANAFSFTATQTGTYRLKYVNGTCTDTSAGLVIGSGASVTASVTPAGPVSLCSSLTADLNANTGTGLTYQWLSGNSPMSGQTNALLSGVGVGSYSVIVTNATGCKDTSSVVVVSNGAGSGDPAVFPVNSWNVYAYTGTDIALGSGNLYRGFYTVSGLSVNTTSQWSSGASPSSAAGYLGCVVPVDNFTWVHKRKGFPTGPYVMTIPTHDDGINVLLNGTSVYSAGCCSTNPTLTLGTLDANSTIEIRMVEGGGGAVLDFTLTLSPLTAGSISGDQLLCNGGTPSVISNAQVASGGQTNTVTYQWQDSSDVHTWADINLATSVSFQPGSLLTTTKYRRKAFNGTESVISNVVQVTVVFPEGNPSQSGSNSWNLYAYSGTDVNLGTGNTYLGFYNVNALDVNTADQWSPGASPSSFSGYAGCPVPSDNFTFVLKRQGFTPGSYKLNISNHDDQIRILVNGVQVFEHVGCCDVHNDIDLGALGSTSLVEIRTVENGGSAQAAFTLVSSSFVGGSIAADQTICAGVAPQAFTNVQDASGGGITTFTYQWQDSTASGSWQNINTATNATFQAPVLNVTKWFRRKATGGALVVFSNEVKVTVLAAPLATITPAGPLTICSGDAALLTGSFSVGSTRKWLRNNVELSGQTSLTLNATLAGTYKAVAMSGTCTDTSNAVVVNVNPKPAPVVSPAGPLSICANGSVVLTHTNPVLGQTNQWKNDGVPVSGGAGISVSTAGFYYLVSTATASGCKDSSAVVTVNVVNPVVSPSGPLSICEGSSTNILVSNIGSAGVQWLRNEVPVNGATNQTLSVNQAGTYKAIAIIAGVCSDTSAGVVVNVTPLPVATITTPATTSFCQGGSLVLQANTGTGLTHQWQRNGSNLTGATNDQLTVNQAGSYTVVVTNAQNCPKTSEPVVITEVTNITWTLDNDGDGYGAGITVSNCVRPLHGFLPSELIATSGDCNDNNNTINPARQFFTFSPGQNFTNALCAPQTGTSYTTFRFEVVYTDLNNAPAPVTFPRVILDFEGNGSLNDANDRTILMQEFDNRDGNTNDGKRFLATVNSLPSGLNYTTRIQTAVGGCATVIGPFNYPDVFILSDLQIFANDINFSVANPPVSSPLQITATVHNVSDFAAQNFVVHLRNQFDTNIVYPDKVVPFLAPHTSLDVIWDITTPSVDAWCPMQVTIDYTHVISESNELDNSAIRPFTNGDFNLPGGIDITANTSPSTVVGSPGATVNLSGTANYVGTAVPLADPSVAGALVTFTINPGGATYTTYTNSSGQFSYNIPVSLTPGTYTITGTITDFTFTFNFTATFVVVPPVCLPDLVTAVFLSSNNIVENESLSGLVRVTNVGCEPTTDSTLLEVTQTGGSPAIGNIKVPPLALNASYDFPFSNIVFDTPGNYFICGKADATFLVNESSEGNNTACANLTVIPFLPDLFPISCGVGGSQYISGQETSISFTMHNSGGSGTGPFTAQVKIFRDGNFLETISKTISNVARQSSASFSVPYTYATTGTYTFELYLDTPVPPGVVVETNEANNVTSCQVLILPTQTDLYVSGCEEFDVTPQNPAFPGSITVRARITNGGNATATAPIPVRFSQSGGAVFTDTIRTNLDPGQSSVVTHVIPTVAPATETITATVDPGNIFNEFNESNNAQTNSLCHEFQPIDNFCGNDFWNGNYLVNQAIFLTVPVLTKGIYDASQLKVRFSVSGPGLSGTLTLGDALLNNLEENCGCPYIATLPTNFAFPAEGEYTFTFEVDPDHEFTECNETNNILIRKARVTGLPDMRVLSSGINPSLLNPDPGQPITIDVNYENIGLPNINDQMKIRLYVDEIAVDSAAPVNGLVTGDNFTVHFTTPWSSNLTGSHIIRTVIDADNQVLESNEANNEATRAVIVGAAANLYFQVFSPSNSTPSIGNTIQINARIGNNGDEETTADVQFFYINNQNDTIQIGSIPVTIPGNDSLNIQMPWQVADNNTTIVGKIVNSTIQEFSYSDNVATAPIGGFSVSLSSTPSCNGKPNGTITASVVGGAQPVTVQWSTGFIGETLTAGPGSYTATVKDAAGVIQNVQGSIVNIPGVRYYLDSDDDGYGDPSIDSVDCTQPVGYVRNKLDCDDSDPAIYKATPLPVITASGPTTFCAGGDVTLSVPASNGTSYLWSNDSTDNSIVVSSSGSYFVVTRLDSGCSATSQPVVVTVLTALIPTATIAVSPDTVICTGTSVTFTAQTTGGGIQPAFEWYLNDVFVTDGLTYTSDTLKNNDRVQFLLTSSESCASPVVVFSKKIRMSVSTSIQANAGADQSVCGNTATLTGNASGSWTQISGTGTIATPNSALSQVTGLSTGTNEFVWSVSGGTCPPSSDTVAITVTPLPTNAIAGNDQQICDTVVSLSANVPQSGAGNWSIISGTGNITDPSSASTSVTGLGAGETKLVWSIAVGTCPASSDTLIITRFEQPELANAGNDESICGDSLFLSANNPLVGTGTWTKITGTGTIEEPGNPSSKVSGLSGGNNQFVWIISNGVCPASTDTVLVNVTPFATQANAGLDQTICDTIATLSANTPVNGEGRWFRISGSGTISSPLNPGTTILNPGVGKNQFVWRISVGKCSESSDTVEITRIAPPTVANAGADQTVCSDQLQLSANQPVIGTGAWTVLSGTGVVADPSSFQTNVSGLSTGTNELVWTISNGICPSSSDTILVTVNPLPTTADAGFDKVICDTVSNLNGNTPQTGTGQWTLLSGSAVISDPSSPSTGLHQIGVGDNVFVWTISAGNCPSSTDTVIVTREQPASQADAGADQVLCSNLTTLEGTIPAFGSGQWSVVSGTAQFADVNSPVSSVSGLSNGLNVLVWTMSNGICPSSTDTVHISVNGITEPAQAGPDQAICGNSATLGASLPTSGTSLWSVVTGNGFIANPGEPTAEVTALSPGQNVFVWTIINGNCPASTDTVVITSFEQPSLAQAGADQSLCTDQTTIGGQGSNFSGSGLWTILSGTGVVSDVNVASPTVTNLSVGLNQFVWTLSNGICPSNFDTISVLVKESPTVADAGQGQLTCDSSVSLDGNLPVVGTGVWTLLSGSAIITSPSQNNTVVTSLPAGESKFVWTITTAECPASSDTVIITRLPSPSQAQAGSDQSVCGNQTVLSASNPASGNGEWNVISGTALFGDSTSASTAVSGLSDGVNLLTWTVSNGLCPSTTDTVSITVTLPPVQANAGPDQIICDSVTVMAANPVTSGSAWFTVQGTGDFSAIDQNNASVTGLSIGQNTFIWSISSGAGCPPSVDSVVITRIAGPTAANAGADQSVCDDSTTVIGNTPLVGTGIWTLVSGTGAFSNPGSSSTAITGLGAGQNVFVWSISNGICQISSDSVTISTLPTLVADAGPSRLTCTDSVRLNAVPVLLPATGSWSMVTGSGTVVNPSQPNALVTGLTDGVSIYMWTVANGTCPEVSDTIRVFRAPNSLSLGHDTTICADSTLSIDLGNLFNFVVWQDGSTSPLYTIDTAGVFHVTVTTTTGCTYSDTIVVGITICTSVDPLQASAANVSVWPNPFQDGFHLDVKGFGGGEVRYSLYTINGVQILSDKAYGQPGLIEKEIHPGRLPSGMYILEVSLGDRKERIKLVLK